MSSLRVGLVGAGAVGEALLSLRRRIRGAAITLVCEINTDRRRLIAVRWAALRITSDLSELLENVDLVVEATSPASALGVVEQSLAAGRDVIALTSGALMGHRRRLERVCAKTGSRLIISAGALAGLDALRTSAQGRIQTLELTTIKPPKAFGAKAVEKLNGNRRVLLFRGHALDAWRAFPRNVNVAATLAWVAGLSPRRVRVEIWADRSGSRNRHRVTWTDESGRSEWQVDNAVLPGSSGSSHRVVLSLVREINQWAEQRNSSNQIQNVGC